MKVHFITLTHPSENMQLITCHQDGIMVDVHLYVDGHFMGHLDQDMMNILGDEGLQDSVKSFIAAAQYCDECSTEEGEI